LYYNFGQVAVRNPASMTKPPKPHVSKLRLNRRRFTLQYVTA
jgi:hypothetical protein